MTIDEIIIEKAAHNRIKMRKLVKKIWNDEAWKQNAITADDMEYQEMVGKHTAYIEILTAFLDEENDLLARKLIEDQVKELR